MEIEKEIVREVARGDKPYLRKSTDRKAQISPLRARSHCGKQNAKRCVFMTVARQICILEYGVSLSCKRGLKRTQTKTGVSEGGEDSRKRKRSKTRVQKCTLFFEKTKKNLLPAFSKVKSSTLTAQCERRVCSKAPGSQNYENVSWSSFHAAQAENQKCTELDFRVEAKFFET